ncbi:MAG: transposase family protein, partial [Mycobacteriaceae bacterium]|nr:transposase family protein [Mycobacteriaceae bacterium]
ALPICPAGFGTGAVLAVALAAVVAGARSFTAIAEWAADAAPAALVQLGITGKVPSESTIRRCLRPAPDDLDELLGTWTWLRTSVIGDRRGDSLRRQDAAWCPRCGREPGASAGRVVPAHRHRARPDRSQREDQRDPAADKASRYLDIAGAIITADALHCQRGTAEYITGRGGHDIFNFQRKLRKQLRRSVERNPAAGHQHRARPRSHRKRVLKAAEIAEGIAFSSAVQVLQLTPE